MRLEWHDIDWDKKLLYIRRTSQYISSKGIITKDTKNESSERVIRLPEEAFPLLDEYKQWWIDVHENMGNLRHDKKIFYYKIY